MSSTRIIITFGLSWVNKTLNPKKNLSGTRKYSSIDLKNIKLIYDLVKIKGFTLEGAKKKLKSSKDVIQVVKKLEKIKQKLINIEKEI